MFADEDDDSRAGAQCSVMAGRTTRVVNALVSQELVESENCAMHVYVNESFSKRPCLPLHDQVLCAGRVL